MYLRWAACVLFALILLALDFYIKQSFRIDLNLKDYIYFYSFLIVQFEQLQIKDA
jgi:hypothetical protein